jgi:hypothetical protein
MNWQIVFASVQSIAKASNDVPRALVALRHEVVATAELTPAHKDEMHQILDRLQKANVYGQIALIGQLKEVLSNYAAFKKQYSAYDVRKA